MRGISLHSTKSCKSHWHVPHIYMYALRLRELRENFFILRSWFFKISHTIWLYGKGIDVYCVAVLSVLVPRRLYFKFVGSTLVLSRQVCRQCTGRIYVSALCSIILLSIILHLDTFFWDKKWTWLCDLWEILYLVDGWINHVFMEEFLLFSRVQYCWQTMVCKWKMFSRKPGLCWAKMIQN